MILFMELCDFDLDHYVKQSPFNQRDVKLFLSHMGAYHPHTLQVAPPSLHKYILPSVLQRKG